VSSRRFSGVAFPNWAITVPTVGIVVTPTKYNTENTDSQKEVTLYGFYLTGLEMHFEYICYTSKNFTSKQAKR